MAIITVRQFKAGSVIPANLSLLDFLSVDSTPSIASTMGITDSATVDDSGVSLGGPPSPSGTIILDTSSGGAQDVTAANTLAAAQSISGVTAIQGGNSYAPDWAVTLSVNASGRAWILPWKAAGGSLEVDMQLDKAGLTVHGILCGQYKTYFGRVASDGAVGGSTVGALGFYDQAHGHKSGVIFRRAGDGGGSTNNGRITTYHQYTYQSTLRGQGGFSSENYILSDGVSSASPTPQLLQDNTADPTSFALHGQTGGQSPVLDLSTLTDSVITLTWKLIPETSYGAQNGRFQAWVNNTLVMDCQNACINPATAGTLPWKEWQIGGPTWTGGGPSADCTQYVWDIKMWNPAS